MIIAAVQARMSSSRLPGKVLTPIVGKPMLELQIERLRRAKAIDRLIIATSVGPEDDAIEQTCENLAVDCFRGSLRDVLDRFYQATRPFAPDHVVRLTADCPLADPEVIDRALAFHVEGGFDYSSNTLHRTWPQGLDVETMTFDTLQTAWKDAELPSEREHVTYFIYRHPERFRLGSLENDQNLSHMRWTVDEAIDLKLVQRIYERLYPNHPAFTTNDVLALIAQEPDLENLNAAVDRGSGLRKSLAEDQRFLKNRSQ